MEKSLWLRLSCTDYMEHTELPSFTLNECLALCAMIKKEGLADLIDCSGGGLDARQKIELEPGYQIRFAEAIRTHLSSIQGPEVLVGAVGLIFDAQLADEVVREGKADVVLAAREFMRDAETVLRWAEELGTEVGWAVQCELPWLGGFASLWD